MEVNKARLFIYVTLVLLSMKFQSAITSENETDRLSLLAFRNEVTEDPFGALRAWNDSFHYCNWTGITCSSSQHPSRVTIMDLSAKSLVGSISPHIGNITFLETLDLHQNSFDGQIPQEIGHLSGLRFLDLSANSLEGEVPNNLTSFTKLQAFSLSMNQLIGRIPTELGSVSELAVLQLSGNYLVGTIPVSLSNLSFLTALSIGFNNLNGNIPSTLGHLSKLEYFQISYNNLSGSIPAQLFNISSIYYFAVANNQLHGTIRPDIGITLPNLQTFSIDSNRFSAEIPSSLSNLSRLSALDVSDNQFTGDVPRNLGRLQGLTLLNLAKNQLGTGDADDLSFFYSLSNCSHLETLALSNNNLTGQLPEYIGNLSTKLAVLNMGANQIFGEIPSGIGNLVNLNILSFEDNKFKGSIPVSIGELPNLVRLAMSGNQLSGLIPSNICNNTQLEMIHFGKNRLQGEIPPSLGNCRSLQDLSLSQNQLRGTIPKQVMSLSSLSVLDLSANLLSGNFPYEVGNLVKIVYLDLSKNHIYGQIPSSVGNCLGLQNLYLQGNLFDGVIPSSLETLRGVQILDLSRNRLSGKIPEFLGSFLSLTYLNLSFNELEGEVPKQGIFENTSAFSILGNKKLCSEIPLLHLPSCQRPGPESNQSKHFPLVRLLLIIFGAVIFAVLYCLFHIFIWRVKAQERPSTSSESPLGYVFQKVSYNELRNATNGFSTDNLVGVGSYGSVYRGLLKLNQETTTVVAVKVLNLQRRGASKSFMAECQALRCIRHRNLVKILTSCSSVDFKGNEFKSLVLEFMPNGSLENWLHPTSNDEQLHRSTRRSLSFMERLYVAIDIATALDYLHRQCQTPIVHCDLKPSNVLLDDDMIAHIGDFGLAKFLGEVTINVESESHTSNPSAGIRGTVGYAAPEYGMGTEISKKGDIYSFGILLLELFTGRRPTDNMFKDGLSLHSLAKTSLLTDRVIQIVDPILLVPVQLQNQHDIIEDLQINGDMEVKLCEALTRIVKLAVACSGESPKERMETVQVVKMLQSIKNLYFYLKIGYIIKKEGKGYNHLQERNERIYNSEIRIMKPKCSCR
ncbi:hypothetical protein MKX03_032635 [Papaver bracteatum]|nr:hypothetical protein MKX03_032635 [Papaver bracteatum]